MRNPRQFIHPLAIGAPEPPLEIPFKPSRMIHFLDFSNEKMAAKAPDIAKQADILLGNLEDAIPVDKKEAAREGLIKAAKETDFGETRPLDARQLAREPLGARRPHPARHRDRRQARGDHGARRSRAPWDIHYVDRLLAQLEAKAGLERPLLIHAILETSLGVVNLEEIATASPRMQGMSFGPADLAASRRMKTTRVGGGHPGYQVIEDPDPDNPDAPRVDRPAGPVALLDRPHGRRLHLGRDPALLRPLRRHQGRPGLRDAVPRRLPARLRRRLVAAPGPDRDRQEGLQPAAGRGQVRQEGPRGDPRRPRRPHDRRQDAGRRHLEAVQGDGRRSPRCWRRRTRSSPRPTSSSLVRVSSTALDPLCDACPQLVCSQY